VSAFEQLAAIAPIGIWEGVLARAVEGQRMTLAVVELEPDAAVAEHSHEHEQLGIVLHGSMTLRVDAAERELGAGDTYCIESRVAHEARAGSEGAVVIDVFAPTRADWDSAERLEPRPPRWP
jgi:unsaturated pyranuronate lyase